MALSGTSPLPYEEQYNAVPRMLGTFYSTDAGVEALINLGNLVLLQPSPYKKMERIRRHDKLPGRNPGRRREKGKHLPQYADNLEAYASLDARLFLYMEGRWYFKTQNGFEPLSSVQVTFSSQRDAFKNISLYELSENGSFNCVHTIHSESWKDMQIKAITEKKTYYAFRNDRLVTTINHPLNR